MSLGSIRGSQAESICCAAFLGAGFEVALPVVPCGYDLLVKKDLGWERVQVKAARLESGHVRVQAIYRYVKSGVKKRYTRDDTDRIAVVLPETNTIWLFEVEQRADLRTEPWHEGFIERAKESARLQKSRDGKHKDILSKVSERPGSVSEVNWVIAKRYANGESALKISRDIGCSADKVRTIVQKMSDRCRESGLIAESA